ncbi:hypothetical protein ACQUZK_08840, partial [Streptococcus pyogenes]|uniref:hypothetical protein n=1 Tax=Streptococcus pyogenes TaxID=1314 RepID=UPI003DA0FE1F
YVVANLTERATLTALMDAVSKGRIELAMASPGGLTSHWLQFSPEESKCLDELLAEYHDLCLPHDEGWLTAFSSVVPRLPVLCQHLSPALAQCERHTAIVLQGTYDNHLRAVGAALDRRVRG